MNFKDFIFRKKDNLIIIRTEGGICSQIVFYAYGKYFMDKGYEVKFDMSWFNTCGTDLDGKFDRSFKLLEAFPDIEHKIASPEEVKKYQKKYKYKNKKIDDIQAPCFIYEYPEERYIEFIKNRDWFIEHFKPKNLNECQDYLSDIQNTISCAVHVRRGDLSTYNKDYGYPPEEEYFINAINIIRSFNKDTVFYFFSEETDWIVENIIPKLDENIKYQIMNKNGADKGYLDLYLMAQANYIIASQGSLGKFAKLLSHNNPWLILPSKDILTNSLEKCITINEDTRLNLKYNPNNNQIKG